MSAFEAMNRVTVQMPCAAVHITPASDNSGNNSDLWRVTVNTADNGGQDLVLGRNHVAYVSFTIQGRWELESIIDGLGEALKRLPEGPAVYNMTGEDDG